MLLLVLVVVVVVVVVAVVLVDDLLLVSRRIEPGAVEATPGAAPRAHEGVVADRREASVVVRAPQRAAVRVIARSSPPAVVEIVVVRQ